MSPSLLAAAHELAAAHHAQYDPSHDLAHVLRVASLSTSIALSLPSSVDLLVVQLAALFHDLLDAKYLPAGTIAPSAREHMGGFWAEHSGSDISEERMRLVERIMEGVSYSKEVKRIKAGGTTDWHRDCLELHCVQDADKLDAIGAIGILRCAAYSGASSVPLLPLATSTPSPTSKPGKSSAIDHFHEKLLLLEGMMKTARGRELAKGRTEFMRAFLEQTEREREDLETTLEA